MDETTLRNLLGRARPRAADRPSRAQDTARRYQAAPPPPRHPGGRPSTRGHRGGCCSDGGGSGPAPARGRGAAPVQPADPLRVVRLAPRRKQDRGRWRLPKRDICGGRAEPAPRTVAAERLCGWSMPPHSGPVPQGPVPELPRRFYRAPPPHRPGTWRPHLPRLLGTLRQRHRERTRAGVAVRPGRLGHPRSLALAEQPR